MVGVICDLIIIGVIALCVFLGYKRGLTKLAFRLLAFLVAILITIFLAKPIANFVIENTEFDEKIEAMIIEKGSKEEHSNSNDNYVKQYMEKATTDTQNGIVKSAAEVLSGNIVTMVVIFVLFFGVRVLLGLLGFLAGAIASLPIIKRFDEGGGMIYGVIEGFFLVYLLLGLLLLFAPITNINVNAMLEGSMIAKTMYTNNILVQFLWK